MINCTNDFIDNLKESVLISNLMFYKDKSLHDDDVLVLLERLENSLDDKDFISLKRELFNNANYSNYMKYYNELMDITRDINKFYKSIFVSSGVDIL